jgi:hypothetical protein
MLLPCPDRKILRRMNYLSDQDGIIRRYLREKEGWEEHTRKTREFILESLGKTEVSHIVVLGSGWLLDFPLEELPAGIKKISLIDVNFPGQVVRRAEKTGKAEFITADITGGFISAVYESAKNKRSRFEIPSGVLSPSIDPEPGKMLVSLNILNQLDILLVEYIERKLECDAETIAGFRRVIQESHINMLIQHPFILVSDTREILFNNKGDVTEEKDLLFTPFPKGELSREWDWMFDTRQLYNENADTLMKVRAVFSKGL